MTADGRHPKKAAVAFGSKYPAFVRPSVRIQPLVCHNKVIVCRPNIRVCVCVCFNQKTKFPLPPGSQLKLNKEPGRDREMEGERERDREEKERMSV